jgi:imidazolonepropionase-like amidohydrolase/Tol biopolymer transport system component
MPTSRHHRPALIAALGTALLASLLGHHAGAEAQTDSTEGPRKPTWNVNEPPGEARTVQIDTRTGTWMSVDVSPDGKAILFDLLGDLYLLPAEGGQARPLTHSIAWEQQARFSPDGKQIAFLSDAGGGDNVWVMNADGSGARAVTNEDYRLLNNPVWHPSGRFIAARKHYTGTRSAGSGEIWLYHVSGGTKGVQLNEKPNWQKDLGEPAISPDGRYLYYSHDATPGKTFEYNKDSNKEIFKIYRQDLRDGSVEAFVQGPGGAVRPTPSPDGKHLAFVRRVRNQSTLFLKDLATGEERAVWGGLERDLQEAWSVYGVYPAFAWTPDARHIVVWAQGKLWRVDPFSGRAADIPFHVKDTREVRAALRVAQAVAPDRFAVRQLRSVNVSPDGRRVVYSALGHLWLHDLHAPQAGTTRRLTTAQDRFEFFPSFSRDGREIVFTAWNDETQGRVIKRDLASGRETVLTPSPGKYLHPRFSPDGRQVVYQKVAGGTLTSPWHALDLGIYLAPADGKGQPLRISKEGEEPQFGDRNDAVYLTRASTTSEVESLRKLVRIDLADRQETEIARSEFASEYTVSPDGQWLGFVERFHAYVVPLASVGKGVTVGPKTDMLPVRRLDVNAGHSMHWSGDSKQVHFALGDQLFTTAVADAFAPGTEREGSYQPRETGRAIGFTQVADKPAGMVALVGGRIVTMKGDEVIDDGVVLVDGNRITAVGPVAQVTVPAGARRFDVRGKTLIPGLIDVHWHGKMGDDEIVPQQSWVNHASLAFGVTTIHDPSNRNSEVFTQAELQRAGSVVGPRIFSTGSILYGAKAPVTAVVDGLDDALTHLKRQKAEGAISVKSYQQPRRDQRQQLLEAARNTGMMVVPEGGSLFQLNMGMVVDGHTGIEHALPIAEVYDDVKQLWPQTAVGYTPTLNVAYGGLDGEHYWYARTNVWEHPLLTRHVPRTVLASRAVRRPTAPEEDFNVLRVARTATALQRLGVKVNIGAHGQREGLGAHWEMWMLGLGGMTPLEAIRAATANPAHYLGMDRDLGSIEPGKLADLVVIDGDVLADIRRSDRVHQVMQNGRLYDAATLSELWPRQKARRPYFFDGAAGVGMPVDAGTDAHADD